MPSNVENVPLLITNVGFALLIAMASTGTQCIVAMAARCIYMQTVYRNFP